MWPFDRGFHVPEDGLPYVKEKQVNLKLSVDALDDFEDELRSWTERVLVLVTEICFLCVRRDFIDRCIELPWNYDEERHLHKCLLDCATANPRTTARSLLVVYYLQWHWYIDAYHTDRELQTVEEDFISYNNVDEAVLHRSSAGWRTGINDVSAAEIQYMKASGVKDINGISSRSFYGELQDAQFDEISPQVEQNGLFGSLPKVRPPHSRRGMAKPTRTPSSNRGLLDDSPEERYRTASSKWFSPGDLDRPGSLASSKDAMVLHILYCCLPGPLVGLNFALP